MLQVHPLIQTLLEEGVRVEVNFFSPNQGEDKVLEWSIYGFGKSGAARLVPNPDGTDSFIASTRYGRIDVISSLEDLVNLHEEWVPGSWNDLHFRSLDHGGWGQ